MRDTIVEYFRGTPYRARVLEVLNDALKFEDPEFLCLLAARGDSAPRTVWCSLVRVVGARL